MTRISIQTAEKNWFEIIEKVVAGEEFIIERDGKPVVRVSPLQPVENWFGMDNGKIWIADDFDETS